MTHVNDTDSPQERLLAAASSDIDMLLQVAEIGVERPEPRRELLRSCLTLAWAQGYNTALAKSPDAGEAKP